MKEFIYQNFDHVLCALLLIGRLGDIISTYIATPNLKLESNPVIRKLKRPFFISTILVCLVPYYHNGYGLSFVIATYMLCFHNISKLWFITSIGEEKMWELTISIANSSRILKPIIFSFIANGFVLAVGLFIIFLYPKTFKWGFYVGMGFIFWSTGSFFHSLFYFFRVFKSAKSESYKMIIEKA